jgi:predicted metalloenzyme YecM
VSRWAAELPEKIFMNQKAKEILGDYAKFYALQAQRLQSIGIDIDGFEISHLAFRTETLGEYLSVRQKLEPLCSANIENTWNGRPISKLLLQEPLHVSRSATTSLIELIPLGHRSVYKMGVENDRPPSFKVHGMAGRFAVCIFLGRF